MARNSEMGLEVAMFLTGGGTTIARGVPRLPGLQPGIAMGHGAGGTEV